MELRRQRILDAASEIIIAKGIDGLTTRGLAEAAGVTAPTLYNLIGGKKDIIQAMLIRSAENIKVQITLEGKNSPLEMIEAIIKAASNPGTEGIEHLRAMIISSDRILGSYAAKGDGSLPASPAGQIPIDIMTDVCRKAIAQGYLRGNVPASELGQQLFICCRGPQRDWAFDVISGKEMVRRVRRGFHLTLAADASPEFREELMRKTKTL